MNDNFNYNVFKYYGNILGVCGITIHGNTPNILITSGCYISRNDSLSR